MNDYNIFKDPNWILLQEKLDAFIESHKQKWKLYRDAMKENQRLDVVKRLYDESEVAWESIEETKKDMSEFSSKYSL